MPRALSRLLPALLLSAAVACSASGPPTLPFAQHIGAMHATLATRLIAREDPDSLRALGEGWSVDSGQGHVVGFWAVGDEAELHLFTVQPGPHVLKFEASPLKGVTTQGVSARLNGTVLSTPLSLADGWHQYEIALPAESMHIGYNRLVLSFANPLRPKDLDPTDPDERRLAARFRYLMLVPPVARPLAPPPAIEEPPPGTDAAATAATTAESVSTHEQEAGITISADTSTQPEPAPFDGPGPLWAPPVVDAPREGKSIVTPPGSMLELAVHLPAHARLAGAPEIRARDDQEGRIDWSVELIDEQGSVERLASSARRWFRSGVSADLDRWADQDVTIRVRCWGEAEGDVVWHGLGLYGAVDTTQLDLPRLPIPEASGKLGKRDIVVILLDAARADAFSTYRGATATPAVDALAADGTRFERAYAPAPWTGQSVYSVFTGRYPEAHGVTAWKDTLPEQIHSLFQHLYAAGYHTYLWTEHPMYRSTRSLRYDVDTIVDLRPRDRVRRLQLLPKAADMFRPDKPTFAFIHLVPPHAPYDPPAPYLGSLSGWYRGDFSIDPAHLEEYSESVGLPAPSPEDVRFAWSRYLENVQYADDLVGRIVRTLKRAGRYDNALVILLSDHGESFYEHGHFLHTWPLYQELLRVPLILKWPRDEKGFERAVDVPVSLVDLAPTLLDGIGVDAEGLGYQGVSLLPIAFDGFAPARQLYASTVGVSLRTRGELPAKPMATLLDHGYKVIWDEVSGRVQLYDLNQDPGEEHELSGTRPVLAQRLFQRLRLQLEANYLVLGGLKVKEAEGELDPEVAERLRSLGYIR